MIKVLFIHTKLTFGGAEQALFDLVNLLDKSKFDVTVLVRDEGGIWEEKFRNAGIRVVSVYGCQVSTNNLFVKLLNYQKRKQIERAYAVNGLGLLDTCLPETFDIIVSYSIWTFEEMCFRRNTKTVKYIHGNVESNAYYHEAIKRTNATLKKFDRIICVSQEGKDALVRALKQEAGVVKIFNPINSIEIRKKAEKDVSLSPKTTICAVGRLSKEKGFERLVRIHKNLLVKGYDHQLVIVGDGEEREQIEKVISQTETENSVILAGYQENPYPYMRLCKFMVCSSYTEGLPVIAMEALSLGIPIVSAVPSISEIFGDEKCGIITQNDDSSLEAGIEQMLSNELLYMSAKRAAQRRSSYFDGQRMVREVENLFLELVVEE